MHENGNTLPSRLFCSYGHATSCDFIMTLSQPSSIHPFVFKFPGCHERLSNGSGNAES